MTAAGIWAHPADSLLTVVLVRPDGTRPPPIYVPRTDLACAGVAQYLGAFAAEVAVPSSVAQQDSLTELLRAQPFTAWVVPDPLLVAIAEAVGLGPTAARSRAAILARLPAVAAFKPLLRRIPPPDPRQLVLLR